MDPCATCRDLEPLPGFSGGFITGGTGQDLKDSGSTCQLCSILWEGLEVFCLNSPATVQWMALRQAEDSFRLQYKRSSAERAWMGLHFYTKYSQDRFSDVFKPTNDLEPDTACIKYLSQMKGWIKTCDEKHQVCKSRQNNYLPTRVLDVSRDPDRIFLYEPAKADKGPYTALSHCWGGVVPIITTENTLDKFKAGISIEAFPKTFRDAILVTRELECRYIWIDSLCIVQDSKDDWRHEASRMADVYGNSYVTISATASENSSGGLFRRHDPLDLKHTVQRPAENGVCATVHVRPALEHAPYFASSPYGLESSTPGPLLERSWCFQEYLLAPRVLSFTEWEILWLCLSKRSCNCGEYNEDMRDIVAASDLKARFDTQLRDSSPKDLRRLWQDVVEAYLLKGLTYDTDRLPALAGIAHLFSQRSLGRYVNGLWEPTLVADLFWGLDSSFAQNYDIVAKRTLHQAMPSWSWASVSGSFRYAPSTYVFEGIKIISISWEPMISNPLAQVSTKTITIRGVLVQALAWGGADYEKNPSNHYRRVQIHNEKDHSWLVDVTSELYCDPDNPADVYIFSGTKGPGLVLRNVKGSSSTYQRIGFIEGYPPKRDERGSETIQMI
ncbi:HET-domain-containing protein [Hypoxylon trugodes]|uniref:HET-domain-containing protein n=1 Tax=Hypoxylon trugodes TaxID=326681 RepID=UPI00219573C5|nr:HET-domain-containing protein [Hypoxylon trugodes]KAI1388082.1 HET-domain-containing protein [Hypoxylon trugodes]